MRAAQSFPLSTSSFLEISYCHNVTVCINFIIIIITIIYPVFWLLKYFVSANAQLKEQHDDNETTTELTTIKPKKNLNLNPVEKQKEELIQNYNRFHKRWMDELMGTKLR